MDFTVTRLSYKVQILETVAPFSSALSVVPVDGAALFAAAFTRTPSASFQQ